MLGTCLGGRGKEELVLLVGESRLGNVAQGSKGMAQEMIVIVGDCVTQPSASVWAFIRENLALNPSPKHTICTGVHTEFSYKMSRNVMLCEKDRGTSV